MSEPISDDRIEDLRAKAERRPWRYPEVPELLAEIDRLNRELWSWKGTVDAWEAGLRPD